jgi:hypothetical protein
MSKYLRVIYECEIEIVDPIAAAATTMDWTRDELGRPVMMSRGTDEAAVLASVNVIITSALIEGGPGGGFKYFSGRVLPRSRDEAGNYPEVLLAPSLGSDDDGNQHALPLI